MDRYGNLDAAEHAERLAAWNARLSNPVPLCMPADTIEAVSRTIKIASADLFALLDKADADTKRRLGHEAEVLARLFDCLYYDCTLKDVVK